MLRCCVCSGKYLISAETSFLLEDLNETLLANGLLRAEGELQGHSQIP